MMRLEQIENPSASMQCDEKLIQIWIGLVANAQREASSDRSFFHPYQSIHTLNLIFKFTFEFRMCMERDDRQSRDREPMLRLGCMCTHADIAEISERCKKEHT